MSLMAFSVRRTSLVKPRYLWAALNVTLEKRVRMTEKDHVSLVSRPCPRSERYGNGETHDDNSASKYTQSVKDRNGLGTASTSPGLKAVGNQTRG